MLAETIIEISSLFVSAALLLIFVPKNKIREASVIFCFKQLITWLLGLFVAEFNLIEYPVRLFANATKASFTFEYFVYPSICVIFNLYYPERKSLFKRILYYFIYTAAITVFEVILEKYTQNIKYINWTWYYTFLSVYLTFFLSRAYFKWFFKISNNAPCWFKESCCFFYCLKPGQQSKVKEVSRRLLSICSSWKLQPPAEWNPLIFSVKDLNS